MFHCNNHTGRYLCIDIQDIPSACLLRFVRKAVRFIEDALVSNIEIERKNKVLIHCVHGQSRSCAICIAFFMKIMVLHSLQPTEVLDNSNNHALYTTIKLRLLAVKSNHGFVNGDSISWKNEKQWVRSVGVLWSCYNAVSESRPIMAINPGFIRQLEMFRRTLVQRLDAPSCHTKSMVPSRAHASFRVFLSRAQYNDSGTVTNFFVPTNHARHFYYTCQTCSFSLCADVNIIYDVIDPSTLPASDYWKENAVDGKIFYQNYDPTTSKTSEMATATYFDQGIQIELMEWMRSSMIEQGNNTVIMPKGRLKCPSCQTHVGYWDWCHDVIIYGPILILRHKIEKKFINCLNSQNPGK